MIVCGIRRAALRDSPSDTICHEDMRHYPVMPSQSITQAIKSLFAWPEFDNAERRQIAPGNALRLFPRFA